MSKSEHTFVSLSKMSTNSIVKIRTAESIYAYKFKNQSLKKIELKSNYDKDDDDDHKLQCPNKYLLKLSRKKNSKLH